jgi:hypothetical protein
LIGVAASLGAPGEHGQRGEMNGIVGTPIAGAKSSAVSAKRS